MRFSELVKLGYRTVPVIAYKNQAIPGIDLGPVAKLLGFSYDSTPHLSPEELTQRLCSFIRWIDESFPNIPSELHTKTIPGRDRTLWGLIEHMNEIVSVYLRVARGQQSFTTQAADAEPSDRLTASQIHASLQSHVTTLNNERADHARKIDTYFGDTTLHYVLERTTWHVAQHIRQLIDLTMSQSDTTLPALDQTLFEHLPMPQQVWD